MREISPHDLFDQWSDAMEDLFPGRPEDEYQAFLAGYQEGKRAVQTVPRAYKDKCKNGHPQTTENTYYLRTCRQCQIDRSAKWASVNRRKGGKEARSGS